MRKRSKGSLIGFACVASGRVLGFCLGRYAGMMDAAQVPWQMALANPILGLDMFATSPAFTRLVKVLELESFV